MALTYLIKIDSTDITKLAKYVVGRNQLWSESGRTMSGKLKATRVGIFPKLELEFSYMNREQASLIGTLLKPAQFTVTYWDFISKTYKSGEYYCNNYNMEIYDMHKEIYMPFKVNLIPYEKEA